MRYDKREFVWWNNKALEHTSRQPLSDVVFRFYVCLFTKAWMHNSLTAIPVLMPASPCLCLCLFRLHVKLKTMKLKFSSSYTEKNFYWTFSRRLCKSFNYNSNSAVWLNNYYWGRKVWWRINCTRFPLLFVWAHDTCQRTCLLSNVVRH